MISAEQALERLREGNQRFVSNDVGADTQAGRVHQPDMASGQSPFAIVLSCSDSRVPPEIVFDCGIGDLFVIRVAGNTVDPAQIGSIEYAATQLGTTLVLVLGHSNCGAVIATLQTMEAGEPHPSPNVMAIIDRIQPAVEPVLVDGGEAGDATVVASSIRANVRSSVEGLKQGSSIIKELITAGNLRIVAAEYSLETGAVAFFDEK